MDDSDCNLSSVEAIRLIARGIEADLRLDELTEAVEPLRKVEQLYGSRYSDRYEILYGSTLTLGELRRVLDLLPQPKRVS